MVSSLSRPKLFPIKNQPVKLQMSHFVKKKNDSQKWANFSEGMTIFDMFLTPWRTLLDTPIPNMDPNAHKLRNDNVRWSTFLSKLPSHGNYQHSRWKRNLTRPRSKKGGIHKLRWQARGRRELPKCQRYYISLFSKLVNEGGGGSKFCQCNLWMPPIYLVIYS